MEASADEKLPSGDQTTADTAESSVWGWLEPSSDLLPRVSLKNSGVAIGRGKEAFEERVQSTEQSSSWTNQLWIGRTNSFSHYKGLDFVEVPDGRVSRVHCVVLCKKTHNNEAEAVVEDCSSNGTFLNEKKLRKGQSVKLKDCDKISLVMSVSPMSEQYFIFHKGVPAQQDIERFDQQHGELIRQSGTKSNLSSPSITKWPTCKYSTAERCTLEDFKCHICLSTVVACVTIKPCGHNFCATCLSNHIARQLENGTPVQCPFRCAAPERFVKNQVVRDLIDKKRREAGETLLLTPEEDFESLMEDDGVSAMSPLCPLTDDQLPLEAGSLRNQQVSCTLKRFSAEGADLADRNRCLEILARLCWSDDSARQEVTDSGGIDLIKSFMESSVENEAVQCNGCLALMSLVRGDGNVCHSNQCAIARSGAVGAIQKAMQVHRSNSMVQLSALLSFIPLALDNPLLQALITRTALTDIMTALDKHPDEADIQCKGLIVLGILAQGDGDLYDAICTRQMEAGMIRRISAALKHYGSANEEVFWGALFALATLARESSPRFNTVCRVLSKSGLLKLLTSVVSAYEERSGVDGQTVDNTILSAGHYLILAVTEANHSLHREWQTLFFGGLGLGILVSSICVLLVFKRRGGAAWI